jgi:hypothetical protein
MVEMPDPHFQDGLEMTLMESNNEIQAFPAQRPAETFAQ